MGRVGGRVGKVQGVVVGLAGDGPKGTVSILWMWIIVETVVGLKSAAAGGCPTGEEFGVFLELGVFQQKSPLRNNALGQVQAD